MVGLCSENSVEMACIVYACLYLGLTVSPWNFLYTERELEHMIRITLPKIIFVSVVVEPVVIKAVESSLAGAVVAAEPPLTVVIGAAKKAAMKSTVELFSETSKNPVPPITKVDQLENVAGIFASSGTTGAAKGVAVTQNAFMVDMVHIKWVD